MGERQVEELKGPPRPFRIGKHLKDLREKNSPEGIWELLLRLFTSLRVCVLRKKGNVRNVVLLVCKLQNEKNLKRFVFHGQIRKLQ